MSNMRTLILLVLLVCPAAEAVAQKAALYDSIHRRDDATWQAALKIWEWAEPGYQETKSSKLLATMQARHMARETATLRRLREKRNSRLRGTSSALEVAIE